MLTQHLWCWHGTVGAPCSAKVLGNAIDAALGLAGAELLGHVHLLLRLHLDLGRCGGCQSHGMPWLITTRLLKQANNKLQRSNIQKTKNNQQMMEASNQWCHWQGIHGHNNQQMMEAGCGRDIIIADKLDDNNKAQQPTGTKLCPPKKYSRMLSKTYWLFSYWKSAEPGMIGGTDHKWINEWKIAIEVCRGYEKVATRRDPKSLSRWTGRRRLLKQSDHIEAGSQRQEHLRNIFYRLGSKLFVKQRVTWKFMTHQHHPRSSKNGHDNRRNSTEEAPSPR